MAFNTPLSESALSHHETPLSAAAFRVLRHICNYSPDSSAALGFTRVLSTLVRLGAKPSILMSMGWSVASDVYAEVTDAEKRNDVLYRLVTLVTSSAR